MKLTRKTFWMGLALVAFFTCGAGVSNRHTDNQESLQASADSLVLLTAHLHYDDLKSKEDRYNGDAIRATSKNAMADVNEMTGYSDQWVSAAYDDRSPAVNVRVRGTRSLLPGGAYPLTYRASSETGLRNYSGCELIYPMESRARCVPAATCEIFKRHNKPDTCRDNRLFYPSR